MAPFSPEEDETLKCAIKARRVLYDFQHKSYKNKTVKETAWSAVASIVGRTAEECQTRWRTIRDSYFKNKKKKTNGVCKYSKYDAMDLQFLDCYYSERKTRNNRNLHSDADDTVDSDKCSVPTKNSRRQDPSSNANMDTNENTSDFRGDRIQNAIDDPLSDEEADLFISSTNLKGNKRSASTAGISRAHIMKELRECRQDRLKFFHRILENKSDNSSTHPINTFMKSMGEIIKSFPTSDVREVRDQIYKIVTEKETEIEARSKEDINIKDDIAYVYVDPQTGFTENISHE